MSLKSKIEAVIYASEEPVTLQQLVSLLAGEAQAELDAIAANQAELPLGVQADDDSARGVLEAGTRSIGDPEPVAESISGAESFAAGDTVDRPEDGLDDGSPEAGLEEEVRNAAAVEPSPTAETKDPDAAGSIDTDPEPQAAGEDSLRPEDEKRQQRERERAVRDHVRRTVDQLMRDYSESDRGIEIREVASGFRMGTKPEYHDAVRGFVKSLKPAQKLTLPALETLAVVAYKQPVTAAEISEIRGVDSAGVLGGLMARKLIATAGRKQVIGRPMLYKTTRDFLLRFGLKDLNELPSPEEFESMAGELAEQEDLPMESADAIVERANARGDAEHIRETNGEENEDNPVNETDNQHATEQQATAESAAGGNHEEGNEEQSGSEAEQNTDENTDGGPGQDGDGPSEDEVVAEAETEASQR